MSLVFRNALMPSENQQFLRLRLNLFMRRYLLAPLIFTLSSSVWLMAHDKEEEDFSKIIQEIKECTDKGNCADQESFEQKCV